ncbi:MAG: coenzyme F420-0:L-glutamate ligase [Actinobacteria bacterium ATB1]|nr:coenzyme F420-0:L-glutamate ligase [Actinobacteria bacterium ATB1]
MEKPRELRVLPVDGVGEVRAGDRLDVVVNRALEACGIALRESDVLVVTSKIVSKAEGRVVAVDEADPEARTRLVLEQATTVLRRRDSLLITETSHGFVCANAGVDWSNTEPGTAVLLPENPDRSARGLRDRLAARFGLGTLGVVITDTVGRPWRRGLVDIAIGSAGFAPLLDLVGTEDGTGRELHVTEIALADEIAASAEIVCGKAWRRPVAVVRGIDITGEGSARELVRPPRDDLFR